MIKPCRQKKKTSSERCFFALQGYQPLIYPTRSPCAFSSIWSGMRGMQTLCTQSNDGRKISSGDTAEQGVGILSVPQITLCLKIRMDLGNRMSHRSQCVRCAGFTFLFWACALPTITCRSTGRGKDCMWRELLPIDSYFGSSCKELWVWDYYCL